MGVSNAINTNALYLLLAENILFAYGNGLHIALHWHREFIIVGLRRSVNVKTKLTNADCGDETAVHAHNTTVAPAQTAVVDDVPFGCGDRTSSY